MANIKALLGFSLCIFFLIAILEFHTADARRGGGSRGGFRSSSRYRSSYRSSYRSTRVRTGSRIRVRNRIRSGSSPFSRTTFKAALFAGGIYGASRYMRTSTYRRYPDRMPTVCTNNYESDENHTVYGYFICPRYGEPVAFSYCCGDSMREKCCAYFGNSGNDKGRTAGIVIGVILVLIIIAVVVYCVCKRSGTSGQVINKFSSQKDHDTKYTVVTADPGPMKMNPVPTQPPTQEYDNFPPQQPYPAQPPGGAYPPPYAPSAQPPQPGYYPPPNPQQPYAPPYGQPNYPEADSQGGMPYPAPGAPGAYPPPGNMSYPPPSDAGVPPPPTFGYGNPAYPPGPPPAYPPQ